MIKFLAKFLMRSRGIEASRWSCIGGSISVGPTTPGDEPTTISEAMDKYWKKRAHPGIELSDEMRQVVLLMREDTGKIQQGQAALQRGQLELQTQVRESSESTLQVGS